MCLWLFQPFETSKVHFQSTQCLTFKPLRASSLCCLQVMSNLPCDGKVASESFRAGEGKKTGKIWGEKTIKYWFPSTVKWWRRWELYNHSTAFPFQFPPLYTLDLHHYFNLLQKCLAVLSVLGGSTVPVVFFQPVVSLLFFLFCSFLWRTSLYWQQEAIPLKTWKLPNLAPD